MMDAEPMQTSRCVRSPAACCLLPRVKPMMPPQIVATRKRRVMLSKLISRR